MSCRDSTASHDRQLQWVLMVLFHLGDELCVRPLPVEKYVTSTLTVADSPSALLSSAGMRIHAQSKKDAWFKAASLAQPGKSLGHKNKAHIKANCYILVFTTHPRGKNGLIGGVNNERKKC